MELRTLLNNLEGTTYSQSKINTMLWSSLYNRDESSTGMGLSSQGHSIIDLNANKVIDIVILLVTCLYNPIPTSYEACKECLRTYECGYIVVLMRNVSKKEPFNGSVLSSRRPCNQSIMKTVPFTNLMNCFYRCLRPKQ